MVIDILAIKKVFDSGYIKQLMKATMGLA